MSTPCPIQYKLSPAQEWKNRSSSPKTPIESTPVKSVQSLESPLAKRVVEKRDSSSQTDPIIFENQENTTQMTPSPVDEDKCKILEGIIEELKTQNSELVARIKSLEEEQNVTNVQKSTRNQMLEIKLAEAHEEIYKLKNMLVVYQNKSPKANIRNGNLSPEQGKQKSSPTKAKDVTDSSPKRIFGTFTTYTTGPALPHTAACFRKNLRPTVVTLNYSAETRQIKGVSHFDLDTRLWSKFSPKKLPKLLVTSVCYQPKHGSFVVLDSGKDKCRVYEYFVESDHWKKLPSLLGGTKVHFSIYRNHANTMVLIGQILNGIMCEYDFMRREWYKIASGIPTIQFDKASVCYREDNDALYLTEGNELWCFKFVSNTWYKLVVTGQVPKGLSNHSSIIIENKYLVLFGGTSLSQESPEDCKNIFVLDLQIMPLTWHALQNVTHDRILPRSRATMAVIDHQLFIVGGTVESASTCDIFAVQLSYF